MRANSARAPTAARTALSCASCDDDGPRVGGGIGEESRIGGDVAAERVDGRAAHA